jgi:hypothetical protein
VKLRRMLLERQLLDIQFESTLLFERGVVPSPGAGQPPSPCIAKTVESLHETCFSGETYHLQRKPGHPSRVSGDDLNA